MLRTKGKPGGSSELRWYAPPKVSAVLSLSYDRGTHDANLDHHGAEVAISVKDADFKLMQPENFTKNAAGDWAYNEGMVSMIFIISYS